MTKKILIIGGLGFIGKNLYLDLKAKGYKTGDIISTHEIQDTDIFAPIDVIFSLAGISGAATSFSKPYQDIDVNLKGHLNILEACCLSKNRIKIIFPSSRLVYGKPQYLPIDEKHPTKPESLYAIHKYTVEQYYLLYAQLHNINAIILRISNPYGPYQDSKMQNHGILNNFIKKAVNQEQIVIYGDGQQRRDFFYIKDLTELMMTIAETYSQNDIFNVGNTSNIALIHTIQILKEFIPNINYKHIEWPNIDKQIETGDYISNISKAKTILGWEPRTDIRTGIKETIDYYKSIL